MQRMALVAIVASQSNRFDAPPLLKYGFSAITIGSVGAFSRHPTMPKMINQVTRALAANCRREGLKVGIMIAGMGG
jgi:hypothetical protein